MRCETRRRSHQNDTRSEFHPGSNSGDITKRRCDGRIAATRESWPMKPNPLSDAIAFLLQPAWTTGIFWLLVLASVVTAVYAFRTIPGQGSAAHIGNWVFRVLIG